MLIECVGVSCSDNMLNARLIVPALGESSGDKPTSNAWMCSDLESFSVYSMGDIHSPVRSEFK